MHMLKLDQLYAQEIRLYIQRMISELLEVQLD